MNWPRPRLNLLGMIGLVALAAVSLWIGIPYLDPDPIRRWQREIRGTNPTNVHDAVMQAIAGKVPGLDSERAVAEFIGMLGEDDRSRSFAALYLGEFGAKAKPALPILIAGLRDELPEDRQVFALAIGHILGQLPDDDPIKRDTVSQLLANLKRSEPALRVWSAWCLNVAGEKKAAIPILIAALKEPGHNSTTRVLVLRALGQAKLEPEALDALLAILEATKVEPDGTVGFAQIDAAWFLHKAGRTRAALAILRQIVSTVEDRSITAMAERAVLGIQTESQSAGSEASP